MARNDSFNQPWASVPAQFERPGDGLIARGWAGGHQKIRPKLSGKTGGIIGWI
ncbi:hypothetical protein [Yersinia enterocolitica]|uniref:hypothetical protein n=1 Tax=Yersinia enterocolitica TaxID=630 RepID=UPI0021B608AC|nr:hypothetical protein [Yersinia enterocolitica]UXD29220.1 hypothetical protein FORC066_2008 [Yersinia enterocolitica]